MASLAEELYSDIQKKLFYIIPEKWESIYLYASVIDVPGQKPVGEMFFYYLPKGIIKKKYVNCYEIPSIFNIDEEQYYKLITDVYNSIKHLRECFVRAKKRVWSNINISIKDSQFKIEYDYDDLANSPFSSYERHVIWRHNTLNESDELLSRKDKKILEAYQRFISINDRPKRIAHTESMYNQPVKNIIEFERTLTVEEAIARSKNPNEQNEKRGLFKKKEEQKIEDIKYNNQILNNWKK